MIRFLQQQPRWYHYLLLCLLAFVVRGATFYFFIQHEERYQQPDSNDYHYAGLCMAYGHGMHYHTGRPMFWRTPGYPWFVSQFMHTNGTTSAEFSAHRSEHLRILWIQILICSLIPLLIFQLAWVLTQTALIAWLAALISILHLGFVLASTFLLTDGIAMILFVLFLALFYASFRFPHETTVEQKQRSIAHPYILLIAAALVLGIYTWIRPMGQFISIIATVMILLSAGTLLQKSKKAFVFFMLFVASIFPWMWRNHTLTGHWFFCPLFGLYFNAFNAPKILARVENIPLLDAHKKLSLAADTHIRQEYMRRHQAGDPRIVCHEMECMHTAWPLIKAHPGYFIYDWIVEVCKTTFDLYASQLVAIAGNCFKWDPLVEYLDEKIKKCLYEQPMPWWMRGCAWLEFIAAIFMWLGILAGLWVFVIKALYTKTWSVFNSYGILWLKTGIFIGVVVMQTGGFGYARLRLPVESLMLILGISFWWWLIQSRTKKLA